MRKKVLFISTFVLGLSLLSSCGSDSVYDSDATVNAYSKNFVETFGSIDANQTWNTVKQITANVSINYGSSEDYAIKVFSANPDVTNSGATLLAEYDNIKDGETKSLSVDMPSNIDTIYVGAVKNGYRTVKQAVIANKSVSVSFGATSASKAKTRGTTEVTVTKTSDYGTFPKSSYLSLYTNLPEDKDGVNYPYNNYEFVSTGDFVMYPMSAVTSSKDQVGIYYYDPNSSTVNTAALAIANGQTIQLLENVLESDLIQVSWNSTNGTDGTWENYTNGSIKYWDGTWSSTATYGCSYGYKISAPVGYRVGFYLINPSTSSTPFYSNKSLNADGKYYSATVKDGTNFFVGLEDWLYSDEDGNKNKHDCNDVVFSVSATSAPEIVNPDTPVSTQTYTLAYEDLGTTDDFDFNDVVLQVAHASGQTSATVTLCAAGGTLPIEVKYNGTTLFDEVHSAFGVSTSTMVNTGVNKKDVVSKTIDVDKEFTMTYGGDGSKFSIVVTGSNGATTSILANQQGSAPQVIVIADAWRWPLERVNVNLAYPDIKNWISDATNTTWYKNFVASKVY